MNINLKLATFLSCEESICPAIGEQAVPPRWYGLESGPGGGI
jgi:hypothetical protein